MDAIDNYSYVVILQLYCRYKLLNLSLNKLSTLISTVFSKQNTHLFLKTYKSCNILQANSTALIASHFS